MVVEVELGSFGEERFQRRRRLTPRCIGTSPLRLSPCLVSLVTPKLSHLAYLTTDVFVIGLVYICVTEISSAVFPFTYCFIVLSP